MKSLSETSLIIPVVLSGGSGSRLWPVSRASFPKQLWPLVTENTLLQDTLLRVAHPPYDAPIVIANQEHRFLIAEQLRKVGIGKSTILLEPEGRNSAPAVAAVAAYVAENTPDAVLLIMPADAAILAEESAFDAIIHKAVHAAREGYIVTLGAQPTRPETGYGYIQAGEKIADVPDVYHIKTFKEKPDHSQAETFVKLEEYYWNMGFYVARADVVLEEIQLYEPNILTQAQLAVQNRTSDLDFERLDPQAFCASKSLSLDYAVAEKTKRAAVLPVDLGWSDVGSWQALWEISSKDASGNVEIGAVETLDTRNSYIRSEKNLTAVIGLQDVVVVSTEDAVLVMDRAAAQSVKIFVEWINQKKLFEAHSHNRCYRPWGYYEQLATGERFQVKKLVVHAGQKMSLQKHFHRAEHWVVVAGIASVTRDSEVIILKENESIYLPLGCMHRVENKENSPLVMIEIQSGNYLGEDDIVRFEDHYNRS